MSDRTPSAAEAHGHDALAKRLARKSVQWGGRLVALAPASAGYRQPRAFREIHAFAMFLLRSRLGGRPILLSRSGAESVRRLLDQGSAFGGAAGSVDLGAALATESQCCGESETSTEMPLMPQRMTASLAYGPARAGLTPEVFGKFQRATGLGSDVLVGEGINPGSIVFYLVMFSMLVAADDATAEQQARVLKAAQACREDLLRIIDEALRRELG